MEFLIGMTIVVLIVFIIAICKPEWSKKVKSERMTKRYVDFFYDDLNEKLRQNPALTWIKFRNNFRKKVPPEHIQKLKNFNKSFFDWQKERVIDQILEEKGKEALQELISERVKKKLQDESDKN